MRDGLRRYPPGKVPVPNGDVVRLMFERNSVGVHGGTRYEDTGVYPLPYGANSDVTVRPYQARTNPAGDEREGDTVLWVGTSGDYLERNYGGEIAITSGDFFIGFWIEFRSTLSGANTYYLLAVQGTPITAAGTAWAIVVGNAGNPAIAFVYSDGTTRSFAGSSTSDFPSMGWYYVAVERVGSTIYLSVNGTVKHSFAFSGTFNVPAVKMRFARAEGGAGTALPNDTFYDMLQIKRRSVYGGANFTPPDVTMFYTAIPY